MNKHPNPFTRKKIVKYFEDHHLDVQVNEVRRGYVIFFQCFSIAEGRLIQEPAGRLLHDPDKDLWMLYWMSGRARWHLFDRYSRLHEALDDMCSEPAAHLFGQVL